MPQEILDLPQLSKKFASFVHKGNVNGALNSLTNAALCLRGSRSLKKVESRDDFELDIVVDEKLHRIKF